MDDFLRGAKCLLSRTCSASAFSRESGALSAPCKKWRKNDNAKTRESLYKAILASKFILQVTVSGGTRRLATGRGLPTAVRELHSDHRASAPGNIVLPVFISIEALTSWVGSEVQWLALGAQELFPDPLHLARSRSARKSIPSRAND